MSEILPPSPQHADSDAWDTFAIGDEAYPGEATVEVEKGFKVEKKKVAGKSGDDKTFKGVESAEIKVKIRVWTKQDYDMLVKQIEKIDPEIGKEKPQIFPVGHAVFTARKITHMVVTKVKGPKKEGGFTIFEIEGLQSQGASDKGVGFKTGGSCEDMLKQWQRIRAVYDEGAPQRELDILNGKVAAINAQNDPFYLVNHPDQQLLLIKGNKALEERRSLLYQMELIRQKMMLIPCPNVPVGITTINTG